MVDRIDKIFYINLEKRTDRRDLVEMDLHKMSIDAERFVGISFETGHRGMRKVAFGGDEVGERARV